jgi:hypothetical protein
MLYADRKVSNLSPPNFTAVFVIKPTSLGRSLVVVSVVVVEI